MSRHRITALIVMLAAAAYGVGLSGAVPVLVLAGAGLELAFGLRLMRRRSSRTPGARP